MTWALLVYRLGESIPFTYDIPYDVNELSSWKAHGPKPESNLEGI